MGRLIARPDTLRAGLQINHSKLVARKATVTTLGELDVSSDLVARFEES
jgi:hypothetical protein